MEFIGYTNVVFILVTGFKNHPALRAPLKRGIRGVNAKLYIASTSLCLRGVNSRFYKPPRPAGTPQKGNSWRE